MSSKLESALALARKGFRVFPLHPNSKIPAINDFPNVATTDEAKIRAWWSDPVQKCESNHNIGIATGRGLVVIDLDVKEDQNGLETFKDIDFLDECADTYRVRTPSGGLHLYFHAEGTFRNSVRLLGPGVDVRADGGFVVAAGSASSTGQYSEHGGSVRPVLPQRLPAWLRAKLVIRPEKGGTALAGGERPRGRDTPIALDEAADIQRAEAWLKTHDGAVEGNGGDAYTYRTFNKLKDFGVSQHKAVELAAEHWNDRCQPPWPLDDLQRKAENAYRYGENRIGQSSPSADFEPMPDKVGDLLKPVYPFNVLAIPPRDWVFGNLAVAGKVSMLVAPPGAGKSTFTFAIAASKITGRPLLGIDPKGAGPVAVWNNEDDMDELHRRLAAVMQHFGVSQDDLLRDGNPLLFLNSGEEREFRIAKRGGPRIVEADLDGAAVALRSAGVRLFIVDPLNETHPADENDNSEMRDVMKLYRRLGQMANCGVLLVAHSRKPDKSDSLSHAGDMHSLRGASSQSGVARAMFTFYGMSKKEAPDYGIDARQAYLYARLDDAKANLSLSNGEPLWYKRVSVTLPGSNESVGVLEPADLKTAANSDLAKEDALLMDLEGLLRPGGASLPLRSIVAGLLRLPMYSALSEAAIGARVRRLFDSEEARSSPAGRILRTADKRAYTWVGEFD